MPKTLTTLLYYAVVLLNFTPCFCQKPLAELRIQMPEARLEGGTEVRLDIAVKNISKKDLLVWKASAEVDGEA